MPTELISEPHDSCVMELPSNNESSGIFKEINALTAELLADISEKLSDAQKSTTAYQVLETSLIEFINNASDAHATKIKLSVYVTAENIKFCLSDDGDGIELAKTGPYDWKKALTTISSKVGRTAATASNNDDTAISTSNETPGTTRAPVAFGASANQLTSRLTVGTPKDKPTEPTTTTTHLAEKFDPQTRSRKSFGQHLGVATAAYRVETLDPGKKGSVEFSLNSTTEIGMKGTTITLTSSLEKLEADLLVNGADGASDGATGGSSDGNNVVVKMLIELLKQEEIIDKLYERIRNPSRNNETGKEQIVKERANAEIRLVEIEETLCISGTIRNAVNTVRNEFDKVVNAFNKQCWAKFLPGPSQKKWRPNITIKVPKESATSQPADELKTPCNGDHHPPSMSPSSR